MGDAPAFIRAAHLGQGPRAQADVNDFLVGQEIVRVETGALSAEGFWMARIHLRSGDQLLIGPDRVPGTHDLRVKLVLMPARDSRVLWMPGHA